VVPCFENTERTVSQNEAPKKHGVSGQYRVLYSEHCRWL